MRSPVTAAKRIAAIDAGLVLSASVSAAESAPISAAERTRSRGSSRARSMPRAGFVCCGRHSPRLEEVEQSGHEREHPIPLHGRMSETAKHGLDIAPSDLRDLACPESGADVPFSLKAIVFDGALGHAAGGDAIGDVCAEEPIESVGHGRRLPCVVFTLQRVGLARADAHQLVSRALANRRQRDATDPAQDRLPLPAAHPVPDDEVPGSATGHLKSQAGHLRVPDRARSSRRPSRPESPSP